MPDNVTTSETTERTIQTISLVNLNGTLTDQTAATATKAAASTFGPVEIYTHLAILSALWIGNPVSELRHFDSCDVLDAGIVAVDIET